MVEVFKTNVQDDTHAEMLVSEIHKMFASCKANFDLNDCDRVLRVKAENGILEISGIIDLLRRFGFSAEALEDRSPAEELSMPIGQIDVN